MEKETVTTHCVRYHTRVPFGMRWLLHPLALHLGNPDSGLTRVHIFFLLSYAENIYGWVGFSNHQKAMA